ncbi:hypothetical protein [Terrabacter sp. 2YAF2]|uniref:hypothetical protein n=1 Tax=Terrabacter sp. 2YAF2 TaxID=3233026 RepID=UPI003F962B61
MFTIVATVFNLEPWRNRDGRDELVVATPLSTSPRVAALIDRLGDDPADWPWFTEEAEGRELDAAAEVLDVPTEVFAADPHLRRAIGLR